jgi:dihydrodipicolinate synthase/N-acetylneuraminate lyase
MLGGMITASGNIVPRQVADLYRALRASRLDEACRLHDSLNDIFDAVVYAPSRRRPPRSNTCCAAVAGSRRTNIGSRGSRRLRRARTSAPS